MAYVRTVKTSSGATALQIVHSFHRGSRKVEHLGSAHTPEEVEALLLGDRMIITVGSRRASVQTDEPSASFAARRVVFHAIQSMPRETIAGPVRATVEILREGGGLMPRAMVGGAYTPGNDDLTVEVQTSGADLTGSAACKSQLWRPLIPGLPEEFVQSVLDGFNRRPLPGGRLLVDRAAFDPVESSPLAFELAAEILAMVLCVQSIDGDVEQAVQDAIEAWP